MGTKNMYYHCYLYDIDHSNKTHKISSNFNCPPADVERSPFEWLFIINFAEKAYVYIEGSNYRSLQKYCEKSRVL